MIFVLDMNLMTLTSRISKGPTDLQNYIRVEFECIIISNSKRKINLLNFFPFKSLRNNLYLALSRSRQPRIIIYTHLK